MTDDLTPDQAALRRLVGGLVDDARRRDTWDEEPPTVYLVFPDETASANEAVPFALRILPVPQDAWEHPPSLVLRAAAAAIEDEPDLIEAIHDDVVAVVLLSEVWISSGHVRASEPSFVERNGSPRVEAKCAVAIDVDGLAYSSTRSRGEPTAYDADLGPLRDTENGRVPEALRKLLSVVRREPR